MKTLKAIVLVSLATAGVLSAVATQADERGYAVNRFDRADGYGTPNYNANHWILRGADSYGYDSVVDYRGVGVAFPAPSAGTRANPGGLSLTRTYDPIRPRAQIISVPQELKDLAAAREPGRLARLEEEIDDIEIRFLSPTQAYDTRFPSVIYLDSQ